MRPRAFDQLNAIAATTSSLVVSCMRALLLSSRCSKDQLAAARRHKAEMRSMVECWLRSLASNPDSVLLLEPLDARDEMLEGFLSSVYKNELVGVGL
mmetsp:Transcript_111077/g.278112  ORF Transcript_111077/g.278112 Transcript_111077/m.278112 type:complete len:97 (+) Transcript_111077:112-402(+)